MTLDTLFESEFQKLVDKRIEFLSAELSNPSAVTDYAEYMKRAGLIIALRDVIPDLLEETNHILNKR